MIIVLFEAFLSLLRIFLLLMGVLVALFWGSSVYNLANTYLQSWGAPCLEIISTLILLVPIIALFYGIHIQKYFWRRESQYNKKILVISFLIGIALSLIPFGVYSSSQTLPELYCRMPTTLLDKTVYIIATASLTSLLAFVSMDFGALLKHSSKKITSRHSSKKYSGKKKK